VVCGIRNQPSKLLGQAEFHEHLGEDNIRPNLASAIERAKELLKKVD
jgi:hypothetical protein